MRLSKIYIFAVLLLLLAGGIIYRNNFISPGNNTERQEQIAQSDEITTTGQDNCPDTPTPSQTEGPYYTANSPQRTSLIESGLAEDVITLTGYVYDKSCQPIANAWIDFWQADSNGDYDNKGYTLRGHQYTDKNGKYTLETIRPGEYPGRTPHIHVKVKSPNSDTILISQIYFPESTQNTSDAIFTPELLADVDSTDKGYNAYFNFKLQL